MGSAWHICETREQAAENQYRETKRTHPEARREQFRAWPSSDWPALSNEEAFDWIGEQGTVNA